MSGHTAGPWTVGEDGDMVWGPKWQGTKVLVANVPFTKDPRVEADARLISAAPDLLSVAKHCEDLLLRYEINRIDGERIAEEALVRIQSAIAKATGGAG